MDDDWDDSVSMRLACLALDRGRLTDDLVTALAVRGALLVDLALLGRVVSTDDAVEFDPGLSGFVPADQLLAAGTPSLTDLLRRGPVDQADLAAEHLRRGSWTATTRWFLLRYVDSRADRTRADEQSLRSSADREWTATDAAVAAIGSALGLLATPRALPPKEVLAATGQIRWLVDLVVEEVDRAMARGRALRGGVTFADGTPG